MGERKEGESYFGYTVVANAKLTTGWTRLTLTYIQNVQILSRLQARDFNAWVPKFSRFLLVATCRWIVWKFVKFLPLFSSLSSPLLTLINAETSNPAVWTIAHPNCHPHPVSWRQITLTEHSGNRPTLKGVLIINCEWWANRGEQNGFMQIFLPFPPISLSLSLASFRGGWGNIRLIFVSVSLLFFTPWVSDFNV